MEATSVLAYSNRNGFFNCWCEMKLFMKTKEDKND